MHAAEAQVERFCRAARAAKDSALARLVLFGSASYGDFVPAFSDLDVFASFDTSDTMRILEEIPALKAAGASVFGVRNVDVTFAKEAELARGRMPLNPLIWATIRSGISVAGDAVPDLFSSAQIREDAWAVAGMGLRDLRSMVSKMFAPRPLLLLRTCDETLFKATRALVAALTGTVHASRRQVIEGLLGALGYVDVSVYERILEVRAQLATAPQPEASARYEELVVRALLTFEEVYDRGRLERARFQGWT